ncbi:MAG: PAS domain S-box protein [Deltaproteobacteria bacterium]|nr:PAS domain S-box protein [Deltaproteobacteria bacterium]
MAIWTALVGASLLWNIHQARQTALELATTEAHLSYNKDLAYRLWATRHGGVYVPITPETPPNPYLSHLPERDIKTPSGRALTLLNPAYMTRQVHELSAQLYGIKGHLTSLKPIRAGNAPDDWETKALEAFEAGTPELSEVVELAGDPHLRFMRPMHTEKACLKCHAAQGYKEGDIRGGISVDVPLKPYFSGVRVQTFVLAAGHGLIWLLGLTGIIIGNRRIRQHLEERNLAEEALRKSEDRFRKVFENAATGIAITDWEGRFQQSNPAYCALLGYSEEELRRIDFASLIHPEDRDANLAEIRRLQAGELPFFQIENRYVRKDGQSVWVHKFVSVLPDVTGRPAHLLALVTDVTERKWAEEALRRARHELELRVQKRTADLHHTVEQLQWEVAERRQAEERLGKSEERLRYLAAQLLTAQETERKRLALELHDDLGQSLIILKLQLQAELRKLPPDVSDAKERLQHIIDYIDEVIGNVRRMSRDLLPSILKDLGLKAALNYLFEEFSKLKEIQFNLEMEDIDGLLSKEAQIAVYRIFQESLTNIAKHARATRIKVSIKPQDGKVAFRLEDNGSGFDLKEVMSGDLAKRGLGLPAMHERVRLLGGNLDISSRPGTGTMISFHVPISG